MVSKTSRSWAVFSIGVPFLIYILHALFLKGWIVDDAGISFVFSRNLALGYGLVSQPGIPPVECYSNFAWVALFTPFFAANSFDPLLTPKIVSGVLVLLTFITLGRTFRHLSAYGSFATFIVATFASINTSFVVWTSSGLENPLYSFSLVLLLWIVCDSIQNQGFPPQNAIGIGLVTGLIALVRPEALYAAWSLFLYLDLFRKTSPGKFGLTVPALCDPLGLIFGYILFVGNTLRFSERTERGPTLIHCAPSSFSIQEFLIKFPLKRNVGSKFGNLFAGVQRLV
jgi:hypothetical protein